MEVNTAPTEDSRNKLIEEVKSLIIESISLHHLDPNEIKDTTSLYEDGLGLDSVDILELVVAVEKKYNVKINDAQEGREIFSSIGALVDFIAKNK